MLPFQTLSTIFYVFNILNKMTGAIEFSKETQEVIDYTTNTIGLLNIINSFTEFSLKDFEINKLLSEKMNLKKSIKDLVKNKANYIEEIQNLIKNNNGKTTIIESLKSQRNKLYESIDYFQRYKKGSSEIYEIVKEIIKNPESILKMRNPPEWVKYLVVNKCPSCIAYIQNVSDELIKLAIDLDVETVYKSMKNVMSSELVVYAIKVMQARDIPIPLF